MKGIDVSHWQHGLNVAKTNVDFVIAKATGGNAYIDQDCDTFIQQAIAAGKLFGFYHFAKDGYNSQDGKAEADFFIKHTEGYWGKGLPVLDLEDSGLKNWAKYTKDFVERCHEVKGVYPVVYTGLDGMNALAATDVLKKCGIWFAGYPLGYIDYWLPESKTPRDFYGIESAATIVMWQFTSALPIQGFSVDANIAYINKKQWTAYVAGGNRKEEQQDDSKGGLAMTVEEMKKLAFHVWNYKNTKLEKGDAYSILRAVRDEVAAIEARLAVIERKLGK